MLNAKGVSSPMTSTTSLSQFTGDAFSEPTLYRSVVGSLQYLAITRPDVAFAVGKVCQFMHRQTTNHWADVKRILRYLKLTMDHSWLIRHDSSCTLQAFSDADWVGCLDD